MALSNLSGLTDAVGIDSVGLEPIEGHRMTVSAIALQLERLDHRLVSLEGEHKVGRCVRHGDLGSARVDLRLRPPRHRSRRRRVARPGQTDAVGHLRGNRVDSPEIPM